MAAPTIGIAVHNLRKRIARHFHDNISGTCAGGSTTTMTATGDIDRLPTTPQYLLDAEVTTFSSDYTTTVQSRHVTTHAKTGGTVTLTVPTWTAVTNSFTYEIHQLHGHGFEKSQYDDALQAAIDSLADSYFTDIDSVYFGIERNGAISGAPGWPRHEYPMPSGYNYLYGMDYLNSDARAFNSIAYRDTYRALGDATARTSLGQGFKVYQSGMYAWVSVAMNKIGSPTDNLTAAIQSDSSGVPSGTAITDGTSDNVLGSTLDERSRYVVFRFDPPVYLEANTQYHLVIDRSGAASGSAYYRLDEDTGNSYSDGTLSVYDNSTWTGVSGSDLCFALFAASTLWTPLRHKASWEYRRVGSDQLLIKNLPSEGTPIRLRGNAPIAEWTAETDTIPVRPEYIEAYAINRLLAQSVGAITTRDHAAEARTWANHILTYGARPQRHLPPNAIQVFA